METFFTHPRSWLRPAALLPALLLWFASAALAQQDTDPPGRVATLTHSTGSVVFAPDGEDEWTDLPPNRPLTRGDRVWTDRGARAQLHLGATAVHLDSEANLAFFELDQQAAQLSLTQGSISVRVRDLAPRENVEVDTPNLAVRAAQPGDFRVDVDPRAGTTRVLVRSGEVVVYGDRGQSQRLHAGEQATFEDRDLRQVRDRAARFDEFDQWAADLNRREDRSVTARYVPRAVVGYQQLDAWGSWANDPTYGAVWFPRVTVADWAPYRYGRWEYIRPWGWTWVDDAPWGFAPFHYGRWARVGTRWCWVPAHLGPRPVYAPALVSFFGGSGFSISIGIGSGPAIGWYPLAPGEAWWPTYRTSNVYITNINRNIVINRNVNVVHVHRTGGDAVTTVRMEDFNRGRPVRDNWRPVRPQDIARAPFTTELPRPERERGGDRDRGGRERIRLQATPPAVTQPTLPSRTFPGVREERREAREERRDDRRDAREARDQQRDLQRAQQGAQPGEVERRRDEAARQLHDRQVGEQAAREQSVRQQQERVAREQERAQREQQRAQREAERQQRDAVVRQQQERAAREQERAQRDAVVRQQQERGAREQERAERDQQRAQREAERPQRDAAVRQQPDRTAREQERAQQREQPRAQPERPAPQERATREQQRAAREQERALQRQQREAAEPRGRGSDETEEERQRRRGRNG